MTIRYILICFAVSIFVLNSSLFAQKNNFKYNKYVNNDDIATNALLLFIDRNDTIFVDIFIQNIPSLKYPLFCDTLIKTKYNNTCQYIGKFSKIIQSDRHTRIFFSEKAPEYLRLRKKKYKIKPINKVYTEIPRWQRRMLQYHFWTNPDVDSILGTVWRSSINIPRIEVIDSIPNRPFNINELDSFITSYKTQITKRIELFDSIIIPSTRILKNIKKLSAFSIDSFLSVSNYYINIERYVLAEIVMNHSIVVDSLILSGNKRYSFSSICDEVGKLNCKFYYKKDLIKHLETNKGTLSKSIVKQFKKNKAKEITYSVSILLVEICLIAGLIVLLI